MKKITLLILSALLISTLGFSQSQRMVLAEESTSSTCWPCGQQNPAFDALLQANSDIVTSVKYHVWWPAPGNDPMYLDNTVDNAARTNYYGINSVPRAVIDGDFNGQPSQVSQTMLNNAAAVPSPFEIQIQHEISAEEDIIYVTTLIEATDEVSGNLVAHTAVIEKHISFATPPGSNGEKDFYNVMKKMLPTNVGAEMPSSMEAGDYIILETSWLLANIYDIDEVAVVGFVQDKSLQDVHQAANSGTEPLTPVYGLDAELLNVLNVPEYNCRGNFIPVITIRNNGSDDLTSCDIEYSVNGGETQTYNWTGSLEFLENEEIILDELFFELAEENQFEATIKNPNGGSDDYAQNNYTVKPLYPAANVDGNIGLWLILDDFPEETTWVINNSAGEMVQQGGPYDTPGQQYEPINVGATDCYEFIIYDSGNNGTDYYALVYGNAEVAFEGGVFGAMERNQFAFEVVGIDETIKYTNMKVFPNPATDNVNVSFYLSENANVNIKVLDMVGKQVYNNDIGNSTYGPQQYKVNTSDLPSGIYFIQVEIDSDVFVEKISVR